MHTVPLFGRANCDAVRNLQLLLDSKADVNQRCEVKGLLQWAASSHRRSSFICIMIYYYTIYYV